MAITRWHCHIVSYRTRRSSCKKLPSIRYVVVHCTHTVVPLLCQQGPCTVPAVQQLRTFRQQKRRRRTDRTCMHSSLASCPARLQMSKHVPVATARYYMTSSFDPASSLRRKAMEPCTIQNAQQLSPLRQPVSQPELDDRQRANEGKGQLHYTCPHEREKV